VTQSITSVTLGQQYNLSIYLPPGYDQSTATYPIIYLTDAEWRFDPDLAVLQASGVNAILVGIGNMGDARRQIDFLMPGAMPYYKFLTTELIPFVEGQFRADAIHRTLSGHSSGGLFTMYAFFMEALGERHYSAFMAEDSSFWQQQDQLNAMEQSVFALHAPLPGTLFMSGDTGGNYVSVFPFYCQLKSRNYVDLDLEADEYFVGHLPSDPPAFGDALNVIFNLGKPAAGVPIKC
jgi:predicted alpha/beta superfamily hydrolase